nr:heme-binding protein 2-like [Paramormyrops kingsleyae]
MALISIEDLAELEDEYLDDVTQNSEPMEDNDEERLYAHWQAVASMHQVSVPRVVLLWPQWYFCGPSGTAMAPMVLPWHQWYFRGPSELMPYICKENSTGSYLGMTLPIVTELQMLEDGNGFLKEVVTAYYLPAALQDYPPEPADPDIYIIHRDTLRVFTRSFRGTTTEETIMNQANQLWELLENTEGLRRDAYMVAVYENPGVSCRRNEIWLIRQEQ